MIDKKIAVFHNFMDNIGGAEIVALTMARELNADIYTTNIDTDKINKMGFGDLLPRIYSIGKIPIKAPFRQQLAFLKFRKLNLKKKYDFYIIAGDWAMSGAVNNHPNMWYAHSPLNELWEFKDYVKKEMLVWWQRSVYDIWAWINRLLSLSYSKYVDIWVANSDNTKNRIKKYYKKNAEIIYPPIDIKKFKYEISKNYWLSVNRIVKHKRIELQMKAFTKLPNEKLIIVGSYEKGAGQFESYKKYIEEIKPSNVQIINWAEDKEVKNLYSYCKGFIATTRDEDFGMNVVEAMACSKPVIAPNEGGYKESILNNMTGILIDDIDENKIIEAINEINKNPEKYKEACKKRAEDFSTEIFTNKIIDEVNKYLVK
ncbi:MAG: glycosyltransferase [bacterium]